MQCLIPNACVDKALCCAFCKEKCADRCKDKPNGCKYFSAEKYERKREGHALVLTHFSLCTGIGGLDLAAEWVGFKTIAQCEIDPYASKVLEKNFKGVPNLHDIRTVTNERLAECGINAKQITVISAGFPCQPYSLAGKGLGDRDDRDLWGEVARVLGEVKPPWFVGENTPGLFARQNQQYFRRVLDDLASLGYSVGWGIWGACDVGAPHRRERVFLLGWNADGMRKHVSDPDGSRKLQQKGRVKNFGERVGNIYQNVPYAYGNAARRLPCGTETSQPVSGIGRGDAGANQWQAEPDVGRVVNGVSSRVDRLRCLGNAVVPQQAYPIFKAIAEFMEG